MPVADAYSSDTDDVSHEPGDFGDSNCSESLNIFIETSVKLKKKIDKKFII